MILRATGKLRDLLGKQHVTTTDLPASESDWYAHLVWVDRRKCLLLMHTGTLFTIFVADVRKRDLVPPGSALVTILRDALRREQLPDDTFGTLDENDVVVAKTASRSMLGFMTQAVFEAEWHIAMDGGLDGTDIDGLNHRLCRTLRNRDGYHQPIELVHDLLGYQSGYPSERNGAN